MRHSLFSFAVGLVATFAWMIVAPCAAAQTLPAGLSSTDPMLRIQTIENIGQTKFKMAVGKVAAMAKSDPHAGVREAACLALASLEAYSKIETLEAIVANDMNANVRAAATKALRTLRGEAAPSGSPMVVTGETSASDENKDQEPERDKYRKPTLRLQQQIDEPKTRYMAIGFGTMGGYGIANMDVRGRIPTGNEYLPWVGLEVGGGWTPPRGYQITAGPVGDINHDPKKWRIISAGGAVLLYFHRMHYVPLRMGWDIGRGLYTLFGYGFEHLAHEGFFSWGAEIGILIQPVIREKLGRIAVCDNDVDCKLDELWLAIPFARFSLHFYPG
ncbi:MAG: HEAT repeat domain-containing protein [Deltaproteobacteria bacterium]|nr:HEAT repeat domain-containing protein [Deltaproteobacteria bacterium]